MSDNPEDYELVHYGVKGMKWGIRKDRPKMTRAEKVAAAKKAAIGTGILLGAVGSAIVAAQLGTHGGEKVDDLGDQSKVADDLPDLENLMHFTRTKNRGFSVFNDGNHPKPMTMANKIMGDDWDTSDKLMDTDRGLGVLLTDPEGRKDRAGRDIPHLIIMPNSMRDEIRSVDDVREKVWPALKDDYAAVYDQPEYD